MSSILTLSEFLIKAKNVHGEKYNYDKIFYLYEEEKITIVCNAHKVEFRQNVHKHLDGQGCPECSNKTRGNKSRSTKVDFVKKALSIHGNKYIYDKVDYIRSQDKVIITCKIHGDFPMTPANHTHKTKPQGCRECSGTISWTQEKFIAKAKEIHKDENGNNKYDYSNVKFVNSAEHVNIICLKHGVFSQTPSKHLQGQKCRKCSDEIVAKKNTRTREEFISQAKLIHSNKYDYNEVPVDLTKDNIWIICPNHGRFPQKITVHLAGSGCPKCKLSKGEQKIQKILKDLNLHFESQAKFSDCKDKRELPFDFLVTIDNNKYLIEFNGQQHYSSVNFWGVNEKVATKKFEELQKRDKIKFDFAKDNNIPLLILKEGDEMTNTIKIFLNVNCLKLT